ncbi:MAG: PD-(D/E)XK nuclease domain-containing protein, partial [Desulfovibrionaceae bacterium]|nr:PD-(D/E)XK nuclease domain-containing protein [Desulfovibrionaceae bacterium]
TSQEVDDLLATAGFSEKKGVIKEWYDGYRFGDDTEIYCPWDILHYIEDLQAKSTAKPKAYWKNTSGNNVVRDFVGNTAFKVKNKIEKLLADGYVTSSINEALTYDLLYTSEENLWTLLYLTGYLTKAAPGRVKDSDASADSEALPLVIPNKEVKAIFINTIKSWFNDTMKSMDRKPLFDAFWNGDNEEFQEIFSRILLKSISFHDYHENFYHAVLTGIFIGAGWEVTSNDESGLGRLDIFVHDYDNARAAIIEVKHSDTLEPRMQRMPSSKSR